MIRKAKSQELLKVEDLIKNYSESEIVQSVLKYYPECGSDDEFFVALAAPSMTGKTQLAFAIESKLPLYFVFERKQFIYKNFYNLSVKLEELAEKDCITFSNSLSEHNSLKSNELFSLKQLLKASGFQFETLGFLYLLMKDASSGDNIFINKETDHGNIGTWMEYFSNREFSIHEKIEPMSISQFRQQDDVNSLLKMFYVFIDEYPFSNELKFVRNLCRAVNLTCVLASTNAKVANLTGLSKRTGSRGEYPSIWSVVIPNLPPIPVAAIENENKKFEIITERTCPEDKERMIKLIEYIKDQCKKSRPGVSKSIFESIGNILSIDELLRVDDFFTALLINLADSLGIRKADAFDSNEGIDANLKLLNGDLFDKTYDEKIKSKDCSQMIDNHFFNLKNPYKPDGGAFLLFRAAKKKCPLIIKKASVRLPYSFQVYFDLNEELLLLACLIAETSSSVSKSLFESTLKRNIVNNENVNARSNVGNLLEALTLANVIESSHYTDEDIKGSFRGIPLANFLRNFFRNFDRSCDDFRSDRDIVNVRYGEELDEIMNSFKVPFLFPSNNNWPSIYNELFSPAQSSFRLGTYFRSADGKEIDAHFDLFGRRDEKLIAVVECKNWETPVYIKDHLLILKKAQKFLKNVFLHLTICKSCADFDGAQKANLTDFTNYTESEMINVYRTKTVSKNEFELVPVTTTKLHSNPKLISIIFETDLIDKAFSTAIDAC